MPKQTINIGTKADDGTGDTLRVAFQKTNNNFTELYNTSGGNTRSQIVDEVANVGSIFQVKSNTDLSLITNGNTYTFSGNTFQLTNGGYITNDESIVYMRHQDGAVKIEGGANTEMVYQFDSPDGSLYVVNRVVIGVDNTGPYFRIFAGDGFANPYNTVRNFVYNIDSNGGYGTLSFNDEHHIYTNGTNFAIYSQSDPHVGFNFGSNGTLILQNSSTLDNPKLVSNTGNVHLVAGENGWSTLQSYDANSYVWVDNDGAYVATNWAVSAKQWTFGTDGSLTFPDSTVQTTAANSGFRKTTLINTASHNASNTQEILLCDPNAAGSNIVVNLSASVNDGKIFTIKNINPGGYSVNVSATTIEDPVSKSFVSQIIMANTGEVYTWVSDSGAYRHIG